MADIGSVFLDSPTKGCLYPNGYSGKGLAECGGISSGNSSKGMSCNVAVSPWQGSRPCTALKMPADPQLHLLLLHLLELGAN